VKPDPSDILTIPELIARAIARRWPVEDVMTPGDLKLAVWEAARPPVHAVASLASSVLGHLPDWLVDDAQSAIKSKRG
jgi:hypothetical protein